MLNKDYANTILNANRLGLSLDFSPVPNKWEKLPQVVSQGISDWDKVQKTNAYVNALQGGNQDEINQAWSAYDPQGFASYQQDQAKRAEERQWHLDDLEAQRQFQRDLLRDKLNNEFALAKYKAQFDTAPQGTNAQQNVQAMIEAGYTPQEAWAMYYGGNNPTLDMASLGQKGQEAYDKAQGEALAKQEEKRRLAEESDTRLRAVQEKLQSSPDTVGFYSPLKTFVARALGELGDKEYLGNRGYNMRALGEVQNALIAEAKASGQSGINTAREIEQATKGLNENSSQAEVNGALQAMQDSIQRLRNSQKPSLKQFSQIPSDDDAWGGI